jgi:general secretion pathway protein G
MKTFANAARRAFTLLEIMLVVAIIALLLSAGFYFIGDQFLFATKVKADADFQAFNQRLKTYQMLNGFYPSTEQGLQALVVMPQSEPKPTRWNQFMEKLPKDPWNSDYMYVQPGIHNPAAYDIYSMGKDRKPGTDDDIGNWDKK